jgi:hypothetical protein
MFGFDAYGTTGLEVFTWVVAVLAAVGAGVSFNHFLKVNETDKEEARIEAEEND